MLVFSASRPVGCPGGREPPSFASPLAEALSEWPGARVDAAHSSAATGLVAIAVYVGARRVLGVGIGPRVAGVGVLPRLPRLRDSVAHPLVAAMRAHLVGRRLRAVEVRGEGIALVVGGEGDDGAGPTARLELYPGRRGEARLFLVESESVGESEPVGASGSAAESEPAGASEPIAQLPARSQGRLILRWPPQGGAPPAEAVYPPDPSAAGAALVEASDAAAAGLAKAVFARAVKTRRAALERRVEAVRGDLARLGSVARLQKIGQLLLAQGARVPRGADKARLDDWETGGAIEVALDPARPAKAQAEGYFAKARRYQRGEVAMRARLAETERALAAIVALEAELAAAEALPEALAPLAGRARSLGVAAAALASAGEAEAGGRARPASGAGGPTTTAGRAGKPEPRRPYHAYRSERGASILVGRGGEDNDALTTKHARPHDLWLHAKGITGAHVVVPMQKGATCPADLLVDAATLAAHFSDARGEAVCEVSYLPKRYVRKPRGAPPGAVTFDREKVIAVRIEKERLSRLLATKEET